MTALICHKCVKQGSAEAALQVFGDKVLEKLKLHCYLLFLHHWRRHKDSFSLYLTVFYNQSHTKTWSFLLDAFQLNLSNCWWRTCYVFTGNTQTSTDKHLQSSQICGFKGTLSFIASVVHTDLEKPVKQPVIHRCRQACGPVSSRRPISRYQNKQRQHIAFHRSSKWLRLTSGGKSFVFMTHACCWIRPWVEGRGFTFVAFYVSHFPSHVPVPRTRPVGELERCQGIDFMAVVRVVTEL